MKLTPWEKIKKVTKLVLSDGVLCQKTEGVGLRGIWSGKKLKNLGNANWSVYF